MDLKVKSYFIPFSKYHMNMSIIMESNIKMTIIIIKKILNDAFLIKPFKFLFTMTIFS